MDEMKMTELDRPQLLEIGYRLGLGALDRNDIPHPGITVHWPQPHRHRDLGWYRPGRSSTSLGRVTMNLPRCRPATKVPGYAWSFPGYKADRTPVGVFTHELGHYVDDYLGKPVLHEWRDYESPVSGYEPNRQEMFAEAFRLLCTNPDLLRVGRPIRWRTFTDGLGLDPGELEPWEERLERWGAHEKFLNAAKNFVKEGGQRP